jgi:hypothetical protein
MLEGASYRKGQPDAEQNSALLLLPEVQAFFGSPSEEKIFHLTPRKKDTRFLVTDFFKDLLQDGERVSAPPVVAFG